MNFQRNFHGDLYGGLTAAVVALPLALAFGVASGAGALAGLYGAILTGLFAALFGGTPAQVSGPTGPMTVVMAILLTRFAHEPALAFTVVMMGGVIQIVFGLTRIGKFINLVPYPVISGFMTGIGCIIILLQLAPLLGHETAAGGMLVKIARLHTAIRDPNLAALWLGLGALAIAYLTPARINRYAPAPLLAVVFGTLAGIFVFPGAPVIGPIPQGLPALQWPSINLHDLPMMLRMALVLAFLGSIDSLLTSLVADSITRSHHNPDRELFGQGLGNTIAGLFGAIPGAGATMRTVINIRAGGRTPLSGSIHAVILFLVVIGFGEMAELIPLAVLAGILIKVGTDIIDWRYLKRVRTAPRAGIIIMLTTLVTTVLVDLVTAVAIGVVMASVLFVKRMADMQMKTAKLMKSGQHDELTDEEANIIEVAAGRIVLFHMQGPLSFGSAKDVSRMLASDPQTDVLILDLADVPFIDSSGSISLEEVIRDAQRENNTVILCNMNNQVHDVLEKIGVLKLVPRDHVAENRLAAVRMAKASLEAAEASA